MRENFLNVLLRSKQSVFSFKELLLKWPHIKNLKSKLSYYVQRGNLHHIRRGLYGKDKNYDRLEVATKIYTPSYISFETVLSKEGIIFQYYDSIFVATYQSREIECDGQTYIFRRLKPSILTDSSGINILPSYSIASPERAFLDIIYLHPQYHFDNLEPLNWKLIYSLLSVYEPNKRIKKRVDAYHTLFLKNHTSKNKGGL